MPWSYLGEVMLVVSLRRSNLEGVFWVGSTMPQVIATVPTCCHADNHDS